MIIVWVIKVQACVWEIITFAPVNKRNATMNTNSKTKKILTVFFSMKGQTIWSGWAIKDLKEGNTAVAAKYIQKAVGGDLFEIETTKSYNKDHMKMIYEAKEEMRSGEKAQPKHWLDNLESYDIIYVGYPLWWGTYPPIVNTFLDHYNLKGKVLIPFNTSEGSGKLRTDKQLRSRYATARVLDGAGWTGSQVRSMESEIASWAESKLREAETE